MANVTYQGVRPSAPPADTTIKTDTVAGAEIQYVKLDIGAVGVSSPILPTNPMPITDPYLELARGNVTGGGVLNKFGRNIDLDANVPEDVWDVGGDWTPPTAARIHAVVSSSSADEVTTGSGAWTVSIQGLNAAYAVTTETVSLTGITPVNTANAYVIIYRMIVVTAGTGGYNVGNITATAADDATVTAQITAGNNQTLMAIWQVQDGKSLYMTDYYFAANSNVASSLDVTLWVKPFGETWQLKHILGVQTTGSSYLRHEFVPPFKVSAKALVKLRAVASGNNVDASGGFDGVTI